MTHPPADRWRNAIRSLKPGLLALTLALGTAGGALFAFFNLPLAWMIGSMVFCTAAAMGGLPVQVPGGLRSAMIMILGIMLGSAFNPDIVGRLGDWVLSLTGLALYILTGGALGILFLRRVARYDPITAFFTATPGGLNEMVIVGGAMGGDDRTISVAHSARVMLVVMVVPVWFQFFEGYSPAARGPLGPGLTEVPPVDLALLASCAVGALLGKWLRLPAYMLVGPMLLSAAIHLAGLTAGKPPGVLVAAAQIVVGAALGSRFSGVRLSRIAHTLAIASGLTLMLLAVTMVFSVALHWLTGIPLPALVLAFAPGGLAEMSLVALALGVDAAFVSTHHIVRIVLIVSLVPLVFRVYRHMAARRLPKDSEEPPAPSGR
ncbi:AbrB family transcriptional regulator [Skermanella rosea]|uniref:AbrB family transcriptional regulator n=1 Tax=Skermanella rosea TaxID=1817965 RepID=UPI001933A942|nr:AbrB family transcriptional regulator [Skermanella rosea]UEM05298.1 AbrB family transcriptional regulator [Skermanella rosea]